jgi:hypothetical protein
MLEQKRMFNDEEVYSFLKNLLDPEMYGWSVTNEVRNKARELLNKEKVETKDESLYRPV